ncbi:PrpF domain-containing protein [Streptomyces sp. NPDC102274]|uniref:PrpF domain-containing protein n=1 Tax=Streptomyces sp. NPDC102274 TaxID=3366151 RepID=UPI003819826B
MIVDVVRVAGAPCPTLVIDRDRLPRGSLALRDELIALRRWLHRTGRGEIGKIALYGASHDPAHDLDYRFVQSLSGGFDFRTGCGHSLLACVVATGRPGPVRVRALTTNDTVVCEPEPGGGAYTVRLNRPAPARPLLPTGRPVDSVDGLRVSLVDFGNPYVFVDTADLGLPAPGDLRSAEGDVLDRLLRVRARAARLLGLPAHGALPKIAAVAAYGAGGLTVRAVTTTGWHPSLALTGAACLTAAATVPGTVPHRLAGHGRGAAPGPYTLRVDTPGGPVSASAHASAAAPADAKGHASGSRLHAVGVHGKHATVLERALPLPWRIRVTA